MNHQPSIGMTLRVVLVSILALVLVRSSIGMFIISDSNTTSINGTIPCTDPTLSPPLYKPDLKDVWYLALVLVVQCKPKQKLSLVLQLTPAPLFFISLG